MGPVTASAGSGAPMLPAALPSFQAQRAVHVVGNGESATGPERMQYTAALQHCSTVVCCWH